MVEFRLQALKETRKKIRDLKEFNIPVILKTIEEYQKAGAEQLFIDQQQAHLDKVYARIEELEKKERRLQGDIEIKNNCD